MAFSLFKRLSPFLPNARFLATSTNKPRPDDLYSFIELKCSSHEKPILDSYEKFVTSAAEQLNIPLVEVKEPFRSIKRRTLLKSRFVHKKHRVQYEIRSYYRYILFKNITGSTADTFLEYVERNLPENAFMIVEKHKLGTLNLE